MLPAIPGTVTVLPPYHCLRPRPSLLHAHARAIVPYRSTCLQLLRALTVDNAIGISHTFASGISLSSSIGLLLSSWLFLYILSGTPTAAAALTAPRSCHRPFPILDRVLRCLSPRYSHLPLLFWRASCLFSYLYICFDTKPLPSTLPPFDRTSIRTSPRARARARSCLPIVSRRSRPSSPTKILLTLLLV